MFVGHYGPGFVAKQLKGSIPLWVLFIAAQWLYVVWCTLVLLGINKVQILGGYAQVGCHQLHSRVTSLPHLIAHSSFIAHRPRGELGG